MSRPEANRRYAGSDLFRPSLGSQASSLKSAIEQAALHGLVVAFNRGGVRTESWAIAADRFAGDAFGAMCAAFVRAVELSTPSVDDPSERDEFLSQQETADLHSCCEEVSAGREAELERVAIRRLALADEQAAQAADLTIAVTSARAESGAIRLMLPNAIAHEDIIPFGNASGREYALDAENARLLYEQLAAALSEE